MVEIKQIESLFEFKTKIKFAFPNIVPAVFVKYICNM